MDWSDFYTHATEIIKNGFFPVHGPMTEQMAEIFKECVLYSMNERKGKKITLLIESDGGQDSSFNSMKTTMLTSGIVYEGLAGSEAKSNAFRILQLCKVRRAVAGAELAMHWGVFTLGNVEVGALAQGKDWPIKRIAETSQIMIAELHQRTGVPVEDLYEYADEERVFTTTEAKRLNLLDEVVSAVQYEKLRAGM